MKKIIKRISFLFAFIFVFSSGFVLSASAADVDEIIEPVEVVSGLVVDDGIVLDDLAGCKVYTYRLPVGSYIIKTDFDADRVFVLNDNIGTCYPVYWVSADFSSWYYSDLLYSGVFDVTDSMLQISIDESTGEETFTTACIYVNTLGDPPTVIVRHPGLFDRILDQFSVILTWFGHAFNILGSLFYTAETGLTFAGILAVGGLALSVALLFLLMIKNWFGFGK